VAKSITSITGTTREREIVLLEGKLRQLAVEQNKLSLCLEENEHLKKLLGAPLPAKWKFQEARVVGISEKLRIDKGKKDGVKEGMMVVSENILVGKVVAVEENTSLVQLVSDPGAKIPVVVKRANMGGVQARGLLLGQGGGVILDRVLQSEDIQKEDLVVTSGEEGWLPELLVGQIEEVFGIKAEVYQKARVSPLVDLKRLRIVFLVVR
jgi:rod shape-determining protein MreC